MRAGVRFRPGAAPAGLGLPVSELVDGFAVADGHCACVLAGVPAGDDPFGVGDARVVVEEDVDVVFCGQQRADVAVPHEVRPAGALDRLGYLRAGGVHQVAHLLADGLLPAGQGAEQAEDTGRDAEPAAQPARTGELAEGRGEGRREVEHSRRAGLGGGEGHDGGQEREGGR
jgi:hypothetical protein